MRSCAFFFKKRYSPWEEIFKISRAWETEAKDPTNCKIIPSNFMLNSTTDFPLAGFFESGTEVALKKLDERESERRYELGQASL